MPLPSHRKIFDKFKNLSIHKFVELVETNHDVTPAFRLHPRPLARFDKLNGLVPVEGSRNGRGSLLPVIL